MEDELWMQKIKERLEDYSEPLPATGWERLEKGLSGSSPATADRRRLIPFRYRAVAAVAAVVVAVSSVCFMLLNGPAGEEVRQTAIPVLARMPDVVPQQQLPSVQVESDKPLLRIGKVSSATETTTDLLVAQYMDKTHERNMAGNMQETVVQVETGEQPKEPQEEQDANRRETTDPVRKETAMVQRVERRRSYYDEKIQASAGSKAHAKVQGWSVGLSVGNTGGFSLENGRASGYMVQQSPVYKNLLSDVGDLADVSNGIMMVPEDEQLVFKDGMPYLYKNTPQIVDIEHKQPLAFGLSVRKGLTKGFSVETGLTYTYLASDVKYSDSSERVGQKLHYIGIPLRANWSFVDKPLFTVYVSAGGAVEKCIYGKIGNKTETVNPLQFSVMGAVGAQYNVSRRVGLYVEPGVSYFFDDGAAIQTIRKENPCNFTLQGGIRLMY